MINEEIKAELAGHRELIGSISLALAEASAGQERVNAAVGGSIGAIGGQITSLLYLIFNKEDVVSFTARGSRLFFLTKRNLIVEEGEERGQVINPDNFEAAVDRLLGGDYESPLDRV